MYSLVAVAIGFATINNILLHILGGRKYNAYLFNALISCMWIVCLAIFNGGWKGSSADTWVYGFVYGLTLTGFIFFKTMAMASGPIALTVLIGCGSFIITGPFNALYWREKVGFFEVLGIVLMLASVFLIEYQPVPKGGKKERLSLRWKIYCGFYFLFSAATGILFRLHQYTDVAHTDEMMMLAAALSCVVLLAVYGVSALFVAKRTVGRVADERAQVCGRKGQIYVIGVALACGVCSCVYGRLNIYNSGALPGMLFAPIFNGGLVMASFIAGRLFFKEKSTVTQLIGVAVGILSLLAFSHFFGLL